MNRQRHFILQNDSVVPLLVLVEPESVPAELAQGEGVMIFDDFKTSPLVLAFTVIEDNKPVLSVWPGDGSVIVKKDGIDVMGD